MDLDAHPRLSNILAAKLDREEVTFGEMIEAGEAVSDLISHRGWALLSDLVDEWHDELMHQLTRADPIEERKQERMLGIVNGSQIVGQAVGSILAKAEQAKDAIRESSAELAEERR